MEEQSLQSVIDSGSTEQAQQPSAQVEEQQGEPAAKQEAEPPSAPDPIETHRKGLEAAVLAERRKRQELESRLAALQKPKEPEAEAAPDPNQFQDNPQEYWRQLARYEARQEFRQQQAAEKEQLSRKEAEQAAERLDAQLSRLVLAGQAKYQDFDAVINSGLGPFLNPTLRSAISDSEIGHEVSYWLGKNPGEAARISALPERQMVRELTKLESKVTAAPEPAIPRTLTQARDSRGQFTAFDGPPSLESIFKR